MIMYIFSFVKHTKTKYMRDSELLYQFAQKLRKLRKEKSLTLHELEALTNIDNSYLSKYESGSVNPKTYNFI